MSHVAAKTIVISGYYGFRNSGDEAVLRSILTALRIQSEQLGVKLTPIVLSVDPEWTTKMYGVSAVHRMRIGEVIRALRQSDGLISGGGSLLQDVTSPKTIPYYLAIIKLAQWLGKPTFMYAQGVGPISRRYFYPIVKHVISRCQYISVRDESSSQLLASMGIEKSKISLVADPVMVMHAQHEDMLKKSSDESKTTLPIVGVAIRYWNKDHSDIDALVQALACVHERRRVHFRFLPFHVPSDETASEEVITKLRAWVAKQGGEVEISMCQSTEDPLQMLQEVSQCHVLIGMRLHALIYAASQFVPLLGISYDPKIDQFLHRLDMLPVGSTQFLDKDHLTEQLLDLIDHRENWQAQKRICVENLQSQAMQPAVEIMHMLRQGGGKNGC